MLNFLCAPAGSHTCSETSSSNNDDFLTKPKKHNLRQICDSRIQIIYTNSTTVTLRIVNWGKTYPVTTRSKHPSPLPTSCWLWRTWDRMSTTRATNWQLNHHLELSRTEHALGGLISHTSGEWHLPVSDNRRLCANWYVKLLCEGDQYGLTKDSWQIGTEVPWKVNQRCCTLSNLLQKNLSTYFFHLNPSTTLAWVVLRYILRRWVNGPDRLLKKTGFSVDDQLVRDKL